MTADRDTPADAISIGASITVALRVADLEEAAARWAIQFGLTRDADGDGRALLRCDDEPYSLELIEAADPGHDHTAFELRRSCTIDTAKATWKRAASHTTNARIRCFSQTTRTTACS